MSETFATLNFSDGEHIDATRQNTSLYSHIGKGALYDHVWVKRDDNTGAFIWAQQPPNNPAYEALAPVAIKNGVEMHINIRKVAESDLKAFGRAAMCDLEQTPEWMPEV